jgi:hypothetical protein
MTATFTIENPSNFDIKDMQIRCEHSAPSGTYIDRSERTIFEIVPARSAKTFANFNMGFIHSQAAKTGCSVVKAIAGTYRAPAAKTGVTQAPTQWPPVPK